MPRVTKTAVGLQTELPPEVELERVVEAPSLDLEQPPLMLEPGEPEMEESKIATVKILKELVSIAKDLDQKGLHEETDTVDEAIQHYANFEPKYTAEPTEAHFPVAEADDPLVPKELRSDPEAGYTDPTTVKVHTKRPKDTPIPPRKYETRGPEPVELTPRKDDPGYQHPGKPGVTAALEAYNQANKSVTNVEAALTFYEHFQKQAQDKEYYADTKIWFSPSPKYRSRFQQYSPDQQRKIPGNITKASYRVYSMGRGEWGGTQEEVPETQLAGAENTTIERYKAAVIAPLYAQIEAKLGVQLRDKDGETINLV